MADQRPLLIHHHISKTGGTTFNCEVLPAWFGKDRILRTKRNAFSAPQIRIDWTKASDEAWCSYDAVSGHDIFGFAEATSRQIVSVAFFRDPIDRAVSQWYHHKNRISPSAWMRSVFNRYNDNVVEYIKDSNLLFDFVRAFLRTEEQARIEKFVMGSVGTGDFVRKHGTLFQDMKAQALPRIKAVDFVFRTEKFQDAVLELGAAVNKPTLQPKRRRVGKIPMHIMETINDIRAELELFHSDAYDFLREIDSRIENRTSDKGINYER